MKKIMLVTFSEASNFGAFIQAIASNHILEKLYNKKVINLDPNSRRHYASPFYKPQGIVNRLREIGYRRNRKSLGINVEYLSSPKDISCFCIENKVTDIYVGSDQVLNKNCMEESGLDITTLRYVSDVKKYGLAMSSKSSFNLELLNNEQVDALRCFDSVSVREFGMLEKLSEMNIESKLICDPSFFLSKQDYLDILEKTNEKKPTNHERFISGYDLPNWLKEYVSIDKEKDYVMNLRARDVKAFGLSLDSPLSLLNRINNSRVVITNSFHVCALSIILGKEVRIPNNDKYNGGERNMQLVEYFGFSSDGEFLISKNSLDRENILAMIRENGVGFIKENILNR